MWFITTLTNTPMFYLPDGTLTEVDIEWTHEPASPSMIIWSSSVMVKDFMQAIAALHAKGVVGFKTKLEAKEFGKTLPQGRWKYFEVK